MLTERENLVLYYLQHGLTNKEIGEILSISQHTVKAHVSAILKKLNCKNRTDAAFMSREIPIRLPNSEQP